MLNSDSKGFLVADTKIDAHELARGIDGVRHDTSAMLALMKRQGNSNILQRARVSNPGSGTAGGTRERDSLGRFVKSSAQPGAAVRQLTRQQAQLAVVEKRAAAAKRSRDGIDRATASAQARDDRGRFGAGEGGGGGKDDKEGFFSRLKSALSGKGEGGDLDKVDPAIEAAKEMKNLISGPLKSVGKIGKSIIGRGFSPNEKDKAVPWYRRMGGGLRKDKNGFSNSKNKATKGIKGGGDSDGPGFFGALFGSIGPAILGAIASLGGMLLTGIGTVLSVVFSPIGLAIGAAALLAWGLFTEDGRKFFTDLGGKIADTWNVAVKEFSAVWKPISDYLNNLLGIAKDKAVAAGNAVNDAVKDATGVDVKQAVKQAPEAVAKAGNAANDVVKNATGIDVKEVAQKAATVITDTAKVGFEAVKSGAGAAKDWVIGQTSKMFESGKGGAGTVSTGRGDKGGASYGTYQLSSKMGVAADFVSKSSHAADFAGLTPGTKEFNDKWKEIAKTDPNFGNEQHDFIKSTHFDPQMQKLQNAGIDLSGRGAAVQDSVWSTAVQFGGNSSLIQSALKGKDASKMSDTEIVSAIQDYKIANNDSLFKSSSAKVRAGTLTRETSEKDKLIALANAGVAMPSIASTVSTPGLGSPMSMPSVSISPPSLPAAAPLADIPVPLNSKGPLEVTVRNDQLIGQDTKDRRLASIASGGLSN